MPRDRRWDFLHDLERQPIREWIVERLGEELARDLASWPPPVEWVSDALRARYALGLAERPREDALRFALGLARLDLVRDVEGFERAMADQAARRWPTPAEAAAGHLVVQFVTEKCLALKEHAEGARLSRDDLARAVELAERRLFLVTET